VSKEFSLSGIIAKTITDESLKSATDKDLLKLVNEGDSPAFSELFVRYETRLIGYATRYIGSPDLARDICQEAFLKLIRKPPQTLVCNSLAPWLFRVTRNLSIDKCRRKKFEVQRDSSELPEVQSEHTPLKALTMQNNLEIVRELIQELPDDLKEIVDLRIYGRVSFKEIAVILNIPQGTALWRMHRAMKVLKIKWSQYEERMSNPS